MPNIEMRAEGGKRFQPEKKAAKWGLLFALPVLLIAGVSAAAWAGLGAGGISWIHERRIAGRPA